MYSKVNFYAFEDAFRACDRKDNFSYEAQKALFEYIESLEEDLGEEIELDVIALCCEYSEIDKDEFRENYNNNEDYIIKKLDNGNYLIWQH